MFGQSVFSCPLFISKFVWILCVNHCQTQSHSVTNMLEQASFLPFSFVFSYIFFRSLFFEFISFTSTLLNPIPAFEFEVSRTTFGVSFEMSQVLVQGEREREREKESVKLFGNLCWFYVVFVTSSALPTFLSLSFQCVWEKTKTERGREVERKVGNCNCRLVISNYLLLLRISVEQER